MTLAIAPVDPRPRLQANLSVLGAFRREIIDNPFILHEPTDRQAQFLIRDQIDPEILYGGAAGGGKSDALLMAALRHVHIPKYRSLVLRRTYADLSLPGALMDRAQEWLGAIGARWRSSEKTWVFPSGATMTFGYLDNENAKYRYQGSEFQCICFDELTQFTESQYRYLFSRLRRLAGSEVPIRMRAGSNPGGVGHGWVYRRFVHPDTAVAKFIPARLEDNPYLDQVEYEAQLSKLGSLVYKQLRHGIWTIENPDALWKEAWIEGARVTQIPEGVSLVRVVVAVDPSCTPTGDEAGIVVGGLGSDKDIYIIGDYSRQGTPGQWAKAVIRAYNKHEADRIVYETNQGGDMVRETIRAVNSDVPMQGVHASRGKAIRAEPVATLYEDGRVHHVGHFKRLVENEWVADELETELTTWTQGDRDSPNRLDALVYCVKALAKKEMREARSH